MMSTCWLSFFGECARPKMNVLEVGRRNSVILGVNATLYSVTGDISEGELYFPEGRFCHQDDSCAADYCYPGCDFSSPAACAAFSAAPAGGCPCDYELWCTNQLDAYDTIVIDDSEYSGPYVVENGVRNYHRFYVGEQCQGFQIQVEVYSGAVRLGISFSNPTPAPFDVPVHNAFNFFSPLQNLPHYFSETDASIHTAATQNASYTVMFETEVNYNVCPSSVHFAHGTFAIGVDSLRQASNYSVRILSIPMTPGTTPQPAIVASNSLDQIPLTLGSPQTVLFNNTLLLSSASFVIKVTECTPFLLQAELVDPGLAVFMVIGDTPNPAEDDGLVNNFLLTQESNRIISACPASGHSSKNVYIQVLGFFFISDDIDFEVGRVVISAIPLAMLPADQQEFTALAARPNSQTTATKMKGIARIECVDPDTQQERIFDCQPGASLFFDTSCQGFFPSLATFLFGVFRPIPDVLYYFDTHKFDLLFADDPQPPLDGRFQVLVLFELMDKYQRTTPFPKSFDYLRNQCSLVLPDISPVMTLNGSLMEGTINYRQIVNAPSELGSCDSDDWEAFSSFLDGISATVKSQTGIEGYAARYLYDISTLSRSWVNCAAFLNSFLVSSTVSLSYSQTTLCLNDPLDPCCTRELSWTECCHNRDFHVVTDAFTSVNDSTTESCLLPPCTQALLQDFASLQISTKAENQCSVILPNFDTTIQKNNEFYQNCFQQYFLPQPCLSTADCMADVFYCNVVDRVCVPYSLDQLRISFFECLDSLIEPAFRLNFESVLQRKLNSPKTVSLVELLENTTTIEDCTSSSTVASPFSRQFNTVPIIPSCQECQVTCPNTLCNTTLACSGAPTRIGLCSYTWMLASPPDRYNKCLSTSRCNWDPTIQDSQACTNPNSPSHSGNSFCGVCADANICLELPGLTEAQCNQTVFCLLADGSYRTDLSWQACQNLNSCTVDCNGQPSCQNNNAQSCQLAGVCTSSDLSTIKERTVTNASGFCIFNMSSFNYFDCASSLYSFQWFPSAYGCVAISECSELGCEPNFLTESSCTSAGGQWLELNPDRIHCLQSEACIEDSLSPLFTPKDDAECRACSGHRKLVNTWSTGQWLPSQPYQPVWTPRQLVPSYQWTRTVDFVSLEHSLIAANYESLSPNLLADLQCRYLQQQRSIDRVVCSCLSNRSSSQCFREGQQSDQVVTICKAAPFVYLSPPVYVATTENSFPSSDPVSTCCSLALSTSNIRSYQSNTDPPITTFSELNRQRVTSLEYVVNHDLAHVGQGIGDSVTLEFTDGRCVRSLYLCLSQKPTISLNLAKYPIPDFGTPLPSDPTKIIPLELPIILSESGQLCAQVELRSRVQTFIPIIRQRSWAAAPNSAYTPGQQALFYTVASLYVIPALLALSEIGYILYVSHAFSFRQSNNIIFIFFFFQCGIRSVYFYLSASGVFDNSISVAEYVLVELPTFLYLASIILITFNFSFLLLRRRSPQIQKYFWPSFISAMLLLSLFFVTVIIIFQVLVIDYTPSSNSNNICSAILGTTDTTQTSTARIIRLVYQSIVAFIALSIFVTLTTAGFLVFRKAHAQGYGGEKLLRLVGISSAAILADSLAFIIYYAVGSPSPYFVIVLIFTEIIPISLLIYLLHSPPVPADSKARRSRS